MKLAQTDPRPNGTPLWTCKDCHTQFQTRGIAEHHHCRRPK